jgi:phage repressor protein C with HTH and peptisase S24 domain
MYTIRVRAVNMIAVYTLCDSQLMKSMGDRLKDARQAAGYTSARGAATKHGWTVSTYSGHENGQNKYGDDEAKDYGRAYGVNAGWLLTGEGRRERLKGPRSLNEVDGSFGPETEEAVRSIQDQFQAQGAIREIDIRAGMGGGGYADQEVVRDGNYADPLKPEEWRFPISFMREELRAPASRVIVIETEGDSMFPTIAPGERVLVDTGHKIPTPDGIYAVRDRWGGMVIKRLQVLRRGDPPRVLILSDNPSHKEDEVGADEITVVGRVICALKVF